MLLFEEADISKQLRKSIEELKMVMKLVRLFLFLLTLLSASQAEKQICLKSASTCSECILSGPQCVWCTDSSLERRCHTRSELKRTGCDTGHMYDPQGINSTADTPFPQPQEVSLHLKPGVSQSFPLYISMAGDRTIRELNMDTSPVPAGVNITFRQNARDGNILVKVNTEAALCHNTSDHINQKNRTWPWSVYITSRNFSQSVKLKINVECECDCKVNREENSPACSSHGALVCGSCECYQPYLGQQCQINQESNLGRDERFCRKGPNDPLCSGRGTCVDGDCVCHSRENPNERYTGRFCECSNFDCPYHKNRICGGHGSCECGRCICDDDWNGEDCSCSIDTTSCMALNQQLCNGRGLCQCGSCRCDTPYAGLTCEDCPTCLSPCQIHAECVDCRAFGTGLKKDRCETECNYLILTMVASKEDIHAPCRMISRGDSCFFYYSISQTLAGTHSTVAQVKECPQWK